MNETRLLSSEFKTQILNDYKVALLSREASILGRQEVLTGKAKFGIFGDGKELPQIVMSKFFKNGDYRSGYYRDQTFMLASGLRSIEQLFAQLYADTDINNEPSCAGRQMVGHFGTKNVDDNGNWLPLASMKNVYCDVSCTSAQLPRAIGLAHTSKIFRNNTALQNVAPHLSNDGNEVCFCTIGDASTSEGGFWESVNAAAVTRIPLAIFVWDDGYGISVPKEIQTTKSSVSKALKGFQKEEGTNGIDIYSVKAWDYMALCEVFEKGIEKTRLTHVPALFHIEEATQPLGHSTSGSQERYKSAERMEWERTWDCIMQLRHFILKEKIADAITLDTIVADAKQIVRTARNNAFEKYLNPIQQQANQAVQQVQNIVLRDESSTQQLKKISSELTANKTPLRRDTMNFLAQAIDIISSNKVDASSIQNYYNTLLEESKQRYNTFLYNETKTTALAVAEHKALYSNDSLMVNGHELLNHYFDKLFETNLLTVAFGEDVGHIGDVNQAFAGLQKKYGVARVFDTGIRELSIVGTAMGMAWRGLRPIAEIQYLDYIYYAIQALADDISSLHFRSAGQQFAPLIIRTRGHRLEGIWHSGSPMGMLISSLRGMHICVPRNMTQAIGMYNTLLQSNDPALMIERLNAYRLKEKLPTNLLQITVPLGVPEIVRSGKDITIVSYGSTLPLVQEAAQYVARFGIDCEVIDVQTLLPFDVHHSIVESLKKTNRILFVDEDVPGGATAYMFNKIIEEQKGYKWLDATPRTLSAQAHRPCYGSDGDYFSKPNVQNIITALKEVLAE